MIDKDYDSHTTRFTTIFKGLQGEAQWCPSTLNDQAYFVKLTFYYTSDKNVKNPATCPKDVIEVCLRDDIDIWILCREDYCKAGIFHLLDLRTTYSWFYFFLFKSILRLVYSDLNRSPKKILTKDILDKIAK